MFGFILGFFRKKYKLYVDNPCTGPYEVRFRWMNQYKENRLLDEHVYLDKIVKVSVLGKETLVHNYSEWYTMKRKGDSYDFEDFD